MSSPSADPAQPLISVIIPNWNGAEHLPVCLDSLRRQTYPRVEVIVVDNGSRDGSVQLLGRDYPEVRTLALNRNLGFAGGVNAGIREARGELLALLNNDTEADAGWLHELQSAFARHPEAGAVACKIRLFDRRDRLHSAGDFYRVDGIPGNRGVWQEEGGSYDREEPVFGPCGAAAGYRRAMLDEVGLFDEDFFAFCEDVDLAWRCQLAGWRCIYAPTSVVYHKVSATGGGVLASFYNGRNCLWVVAKDYPGELLRRNWTRIAGAQWRIFRDALRAWRGAAARARMRGQLVGLLTLPRMWPRRRRIKARRRASVEEMASLLTRID